MIGVCPEVAEYHTYKQYKYGCMHVDAVNGIIVLTIRALFSTLEVKLKLITIKIIVIN